MKIRTNFVSNSSSSSYIISFKSLDDSISLRGGHNISVQALFDQIQGYLTLDENYLEIITDEEATRQ